MIDELKVALSRIRFMKPLMRALAYIKNDLLRESTESMLIKRMVKGWRKMTILDVGCGKCLKERDKRFSGVNFICVDVYKPFLETCKRQGLKIVLADARQIDRFFSENSVDIVWLIDVIEHLKKKEGLAVLKKLEKIAKRQILVFTPATWVPQDALHGNPYFVHRSLWAKKDFEKIGYECEILPKYYADARGHSKKLANLKKPFYPDALWAIKTFPRLR